MGDTELIHGLKSTGQKNSSGQHPSDIATASFVAVSFVVLKNVGK
jgi:hypothetical protein